MSESNPGPLSHAKILVTGASGGLGTPIVSKLLAAGAELVVSGRDPDRLEVDSSRAFAVTADLRLPGEPQRLVQEAVDRLGRLDGVVHAAGVVAFGPVDDADDDLLDEMFLANTIGPIRLLRAALPHLRSAAADRREPGPFAAVISAVVAEQPLPGMAAYSAAKAALTAFDVALAREARRSGVRVIDIRPPHTETGLAQRPVGGTAPTMPTGLDPTQVAERIITAIIDGERDLPAAAFG